jgi:hypothetical protein
VGRFTVLFGRGGHFAKVEGDIARESEDVVELVVCEGCFFEIGISKKSVGNSD